MPLHASLVEKDGYGVVFLGPSGMGKSTQAKLWVEHQGADFIIGDRPGLRCIDGQWIGYGMPWDGKDGIKQQKQVPIRAFISLEQAPENSIRRLTKQEAMMVLLNQVMMPMWDDAAMAQLTPLMGQLATEIPFYHLKNLPKVKRNINRFPDDFMFQLTKDELESLRSQIVTSNSLENQQDINWKSQSAPSIPNLMSQFTTSKNHEVSPGTGTLIHAKELYQLTCPS